MLRPRKNSYKEFENKKKLLQLKKSPPPHNFFNGLSLIWDMINTLFLTTVAVEPTSVAFLEHSQTHFHGLSCKFFQISLKKRELRTTHNALQDCRVHFSRQHFSK